MLWKSGRPKTRNIKKEGLDRSERIVYNGSEVLPSLFGR